MALWQYGTASNPGVAGQYEILFEDLYEEVMCAKPAAYLSYTLRTRLERLEKTDRGSVINRLRCGCSPLFVACKNGNVEIVEYLVATCSANMELCCQYEVWDDNSIYNNATPLWCAAVAGKYHVVEVLVRFGADVNSMSDTGSTVVRSVCFMNHLDIVKLLVTNSADIQKPNYNGGTCLMNSIQSVEMCEFLLQHGSDINAQDIQGKTALHYAIQENRFEITKLLLSYGANHFLESRSKDDALQMACLRGVEEIFQYLIDMLPYTPERIASAFELLGSTFLEEQLDSQRALQYWRAACDVRDKVGGVKQIQLPKKQYRYTREFTTRAEMEVLSLDVDALRLQSLIISERILGVHHKDMISRLIRLTHTYADSLQYDDCITLWKYMLELRIAKDTILSFDTCYSATALVKFFLDLHEKHTAGLISYAVELEDMLHTLDLLMADIHLCANLLKAAPIYKSQQESWDKVLNIISHLLLLVTQLPESNLQDLSFRRKIHHLVHVLDPRTSQGDSLLHLAVAKTNSLKLKTQMGNLLKFYLFASLPMATLLVECGASPNAVNAQGSTPLHTAAEIQNFKQEMMEMLLCNGGHIDVRNVHGVRPSHLLATNPASTICLIKFTSLKSLSAQIIYNAKVPFKGEVPEVLETFIKALSLGLPSLVGS